MNSRPTNGIEAIYPATHVQTAMLLDGLHSGAEAARVEQIRSHILGELNRGVFERACQWIIDRHAALRAAFAWSASNTPYQVIGRRARVRFVYENWKDLPPAAIERRISECASAERCTGFDVSKAPLVRVTLARAEEAGYELIWTHHHALLDGWSLPILFGELFDAYERMLAGDELLFNPPPRYESYIAWLKQRDAGAGEAYWRQLLKGFAGPNTIWMAHRDGSRQESPAWGAQERDLSEDLDRQLNDFCQSRKITRATVFHGAWALVLSLYTGDRDVVFGTTVSGRSAPVAGIERMVGLFINTLPVRVRVTADSNVTDWLGALQEQQQESRVFEYEPLNHIHQWSDLPSGVRLFDTIVVYQNYPKDWSRLLSRGGLKIENVHSPLRSRYPLCFSATAGSRTMSLAYACRWCSPAEAQRMLSVMERILLGLITHADGRLGAAAAPEAARAHELIVQNGRTSPAEPTISWVGERIQNADFLQRTERVVNSLAQEAVDLLVDCVASLRHGRSVQGLTPADFDRAARWASNKLSLTPTDRCHVDLPPGSTLWLVAAVAILSAGAKLLVGDDADGEATAYLGAPQRILRAIQRGRDLRVAIFTGDRPSPYIISAVARRVRLLDLYATSTAGWVAARELSASGEDDGFSPIGRGAVPEVRNDSGERVPDGIPGRIVVHLNSGRIIETGDCGVIDEDGRLRLNCARGQQAILHGRRVDLSRLESALLRHDAIVDAAATVGNGMLVAFIEPRKDVRLDDAEIRSFLASRVPEYLIPSAIQFLSQLPLRSDGRVDRAALRDRGVASDREQEPLEQLLVNIWSHLLGSPSGPDDNLFEAGGSSLMAGQVSARIRAVLDIDLPISAVFDAPTPRRLAQVVNQKRRTLRPSAAAPLVRSGEDGAAPLSFAQERLWFITQMSPGEFTYNVPLAIELAGPLDSLALNHTLTEIIRHHESLRTRFFEHDGAPFQSVDAPCAVDLPVVEMQGCTDAELQEALTESGRRPFDLSGAPPVRCVLFAVSPERQVLLLTIHHIVTDGWSVRILLRDFQELYDAAVCGRTARLSMQAVTYRDFAAWQRKLAAAATYDRDIEYWKSRLLPLPPSCLPSDREVLLAGERRAVYVLRSYTGSRRAAISRLALSEAATTFIVLLTVYCSVVGIVTNQEDVVVGTDAANRTEADLENVVGFFVNHLSLRVDLSGNPEFQELVGRVRRVVLEAHDHQALPFSRLVEVLRPARQSGVHPIFQMLFVAQTVPVLSEPAGDLSMRVLPVNLGSSAFDLSAFTTETPAEVCVHWFFNEDLFSRARIDLLVKAFDRVLDRVAEDASVRFEALADTAIMPAMPAYAEERKSIAMNGRTKPALPKLGAVSRRAFDLNAADRVSLEPLLSGSRSPLVARPSIPGVDLLSWAREHRQVLDQKLLEHNAILFRGFPLNGISAFEKFAASQTSALMTEYGDLSRETLSDRVYGSTEYPSDQAILFHNESSHMHEWPRKIFFLCVTAPASGGETPIADCRLITERLDPGIFDEFSRKGIRYIRNFTPGLDVSWQQFFGASDRAAVEGFCRRARIQWEWTASGGLRTYRDCPAIVRHPLTGQHVFFNQIQVHHVACLDPAVRASVESLFGPQDLPRNVYFGDGTPIPDGMVRDIRSLYDSVAIRFSWQPGDILMVENMLTAHARDPFTGPRKIVVGMGDVIEEKQAAFQTGVSITQP